MSATETKRLRQESYKATAAPWKETYRKRCLDRLRESRAKHHASKRNLGSDTSKKATKLDEDVKIENMSGVDTIDMIMKEELEILQEDTERVRRDYRNRYNRDMADEANGSFDPDGSELDEILKEIHKDLKLEEQRIMQEMCDEYYRIEEGELCALVKNLDTSDVICPLCEKNRLIINKGVVICKCGLRIDTVQDCISLKNIQSNLKAGVDEHSEFCSHQPTYSVTEMCGATNLVMSCEVCDFLFIII